MQLIILLKLVVALSTTGNFSATADAQIASVNGYTLNASEVKLQMLNERTAVYTYFAEKLKLGDEPLIWTKNYKGEIPLVVLQQRALKSSIEIKVQQVLMKQMGISSWVNYDQFLSIYQKAKVARNRAISEGKVVYGPPQYSEATYFNYLFANQVNALRTKLLDKHVISSSGYGLWLKAKINQAKVKVDQKKLRQLTIHQ